MQEKFSKRKQCREIKLRKKNEESICELCNNFNPSNMYIIRLLKRGMAWVIDIFEEVRAKMCTNLMKTINP